MSTEPIKRAYERRKVQEDVLPKSKSAVSSTDPLAQGTLTQIKVQKISPKELKKPIDLLGLNALKIYAEEQEYARIVYSNSSPSFEARVDFVDYATSLFSNEDFFMRWIKMSAKIVDHEIKTERALKAKKKYWAAMKERFRQELKALHSKKVA